ncbi:hypothetical protein OG413_06685 [Streptomyces sp. NBC_01433]|uniref:hypothetical protein n=1 Tax=Streptomyces sp. NBC_01433 TaxID=2903864 RepID=UPI00225A9E54|nr:hypothetical protein [Streptomyces sp. NBC_01433]MCX4675012.1 hypothetical protein [Streptomyces sp. NBC_01433]
MRDLIARSLTWVLRLLLPAQGQHSTTATPTTPEPAPVSPWSRPWTAPSSQEVRAIFQDERTQELPPLQRERVWAAEFADLGLDYDFPTMPLGSLVGRKGAA